MSQREANLLWLKDTLEHLKACRQQLEWAEDAESVHVITDSMLRDLDTCRQLCLAIQRKQRAAAMA